MSQPAANNSGLTAASDGDNRDPSLEAVKVIEQARAVLDALQAHADETGRILGEITRIGRTFDAVANHLLDSTFKATDEATRGVSCKTGTPGTRIRWPSSVPLMRRWRISPRR
jgi:hypothetical protein